MSQSLQVKPNQHCGLCKNTPNKAIKLNCNHFLCLECGKVLQQTEVDQLIQAKFKIVCPLCTKMTRSFNIHNLIVDETVCVRLIGQSPSYTNSPQKLRNSSQKNIQRKSIQQYFSPTLKNQQKSGDIGQHSSGNNVKQVSRQGSSHLRTDQTNDNVAAFHKQMNHSYNHSHSQSQHQAPQLLANNYLFSTPQKLMSTIDSLLENSNQYKTTQPSTVQKSSSKINNNNSIYNNNNNRTNMTNTGGDSNALANSMIGPNQTYQSYVQILSQSQPRVNHKTKEQKPVKPYDFSMSDDTKKEQCKSLAKQYIQRLPQNESSEKHAGPPPKNVEFQSIYQNLEGAKMQDPQEACKYLSGNNFSSVVAVEVDPVTGTPFQDSASNIHVVQASLPTQYENLLTFQDNSSQQNSNLMYVDSHRSGQDRGSLLQNENMQNTTDVILEKPSNNSQEEQNQDVENNLNQDESAKKRYQYYINKRNEMLKQNYTYVNHQSHFQRLRTLQTDQHRGQVLKCSMHNDFMSLYDENNSSFCCPSCIYESSENYQKKTILPLKLCPQFVNKDINSYKDSLKSKLQYIDNTIICSQLNQKLLQDNFSALNKKVSQVFQHIHAQLNLKEAEIKNEVKRQFDEEFHHYQKILCEIQPLQETLRFSMKNIQPSQQLDEFNNNLYYHSILKQWQEYLSSYKREVPVYTAEDIDIVEFPKISQLYKQIETIATIKNIQENSCKDIIKKLEEAAHTKQLNHITIPENITIKQTVTHYMKTTTRSKGRNDFQISDAIENIHQQSISGIGQTDIQPFRETIFRASSSKSKERLNTSLNQTNYSQPFRDSKVGSYSCKKADQAAYASQQQQPLQQEAQEAESNLAQCLSNKDAKQSMHKSSSFQVQGTAAAAAAANSIEKSNQTMSKQGSNRSLNPSLDSHHRKSQKQQLSDSQARSLFKYILQQK